MRDHDETVTKATIRAHLLNDIPTAHARDLLSVRAAIEIKEAMQMRDEHFTAWFEGIRKPAKKR